MKERLIVGLILFFVCLALPQNYCVAATIDFPGGISVPEFPEACDLWNGPQRLEINGIPTQAACFGTDGSPQDILDFYQSKMPALGWQLGEIWNELIALYFTKDENFLYVAANAFFQEYQPASKNTKFVLILTKTPMQLCLVAENVLRAGFKEIGGRDLAFIPRYPDSVRTFSMIREDKEAFFTYMSKEESSKIADFYRQNLPAYGWRISQGLTIPRTCIDSAFSATGLIFERGDKDKLSIFISYSPETGANVISISYNLAFSYPLMPVGGIQAR